MEIPTAEYLVFEHIGAISKIYDTYSTIYKEMLPTSRYSLKQDGFFHFEKYDSRFHWNSTGSVIEMAAKEGRFLLNALLAKIKSN